MRGASELVGARIASGTKRPRTEASLSEAPSAKRSHMKAIAEHEDSFGGRARDSVTGWWGRSRRFLAEVRNELGRVTWPNRKEVTATTIVVIITSIFFGVYLYGIDLVLNAIMGWLFTTFGAPA
jgi:preprotein translocase subunit SecE